MKKLAFLLSLLLILSTLSACTTAKKPTDEPTETPGGTVFPALDVWDGTVAEGFAAGSGTEADPYLIATGAQLAYLAKSVNEGNAYSGKVIALAADVDLNDREWTPIGNGNAPFEGIFDGKGHVIQHLSILSPKVTEVTITTSTTFVSPFNFCGLFGCCGSVVISDLSIRSAVIALPDVREISGFYSGVLIGKVQSETGCTISRVCVSDAAIRINLGQSDKYNSNLLAVGGIIGYLDANTGEAPSPVHFDCLESTVQISFDCPKWDCSKNFGGICGMLYNKKGFECTNFFSNLTVDLIAHDEGNCNKSYIGAFGSLSNISKAYLANGYSKVVSNELPLGNYFGNHFYRTANAMIGYIPLGKIDKEVVFSFENLFGCVLPSEKAAFAEPFYSLYLISDLEPSGATVIEKNCVACDALPENHGLDPAVWDLTDLANPKLK